MSKKILPASFLVPIWLLVLWMLAGACANIIPPGGGPRDSLPPFLVTALPADSAVGVRPKTIVLNFNEYITLDNINQNLLVSPTLNQFPLVDQKLRTITLRLKDSLEQNTTYSFLFGDAIKDVNEGNIARQFSYVFSTGPKLDNFQYSGKVLLAERGNVDSTLVVILHNQLDDSAIFTLRPRYLSKLNGKGQFFFDHLAKGRYRAYVLPNDFSKKYDDSTKLFAHRSAVLVLDSGQNNLNDTLWAYEAVKPKDKKPAAPVTKNPEDKRLRLSYNLDNGKQDLLGSLVIQSNKKLRLLDSNAIRLTDTSFNPLKGYRLLPDTTNGTLVLSYPWTAQTAYRLVIDPTAVEDLGANRLVRPDTLKLVTKKEADYGTVLIRFSNLNFTEKPVLQLWDSNGNLYGAYPLRTPVFTQKLFPPGNFTLRILYDTNGNGQWDPGQFKPQKKQPEKVFQVNRTLSIRANWDNEVNIAL
ncbi:MAG: hypothetical protein EAZ62_02570 [Sphingobacteriia bacterium]|nr:MAG: hypothetical protein EAZ62_02570 [Sphingobacteriia bacterium]